ncbi:MAG: CAP domain-containing protein [Pseudomonadota bacterium]
MSILAPLALVLTTGTDAAPAPCATTLIEQAEFAHSLNEFRAHAGLPPVRPNADIARSAARHSNDMAARNLLTHDGQHGGDFVFRLKNEGYQPFAAAENVAWNQRSVDHVMRDWQASPSHQRALLKSNVADYGLARACAANGEPYWTLVLAQR